MKKADVTVVIIARNEAANLRWLLPELSWAKKVLVVGHQCRDETAEVAAQCGATFVAREGDFATLRTSILSLIKTAWLFYLDADERVTAALRDEIIQTLSDAPAELSALSLRRQNYHYGHLMNHGGWQNDWVARLFRTASLRGWYGSIHESPDFSGQLRQLFHPLVHFTHRCTQDNLYKSARWTIEEARLLAAAPATPRVKKRMILRKTLMEFYRRYWRDRAWRDGMAGFIESLVQAFNRGLVYIQVWELQQKPSLPQLYEDLEAQVRANLQKASES